VCSCGICARLHRLRLSCTKVWICNGDFCHLTGFLAVFAEVLFVALSTRSLSWINVLRYQHDMIAHMRSSRKVCSYWTAETLPVHSTLWTQRGEQLTRTRVASTLLHEYAITRSATSTSSTRGIRTHILCRPSVFAYLWSRLRLGCLIRLGGTQPTDPLIVSLFREQHPIQRLLALLALHPYGKQCLPLILLHSYPAMFALIYGGH